MIILAVLGFVYNDMFISNVQLYFRESNIGSEMRMRFPVGRQPWYQPYLQPYQLRRNYTVPMRQQRARLPRAGGSIVSSFTKNVLLLAKAKGSDDGVTDLVIPRGSNREKLHDEGQIANLVDINVNWTEEEVF